MSTTAATIDTTATLYERLGGEQGIAALVDDIVAAHLANPVIKARYLPLTEDPQRMETATRHLREFLSAGTGGPAEYTGQSMVDAHRGMNVSAGEYMAATDDILNTLEKHGIDDPTRNQILGIVWSLKPEIVHL